MSQIVGYFVTGFVGTVFGCAISYLIYRDGRLRESRIAFSERLLVLKSEIRYTRLRDNIPVRQHFKDAYTDLQVHYLRHSHDLIWGCHKKSLKKAWHDLIGYDDTNSIKGYESIKFPNDQTEALEKIDDLLSIIRNAQ